MVSDDVAHECVFGHEAAGSPALVVVLELASGDHASEAAEHETTYEGVWARPNDNQPSTALGRDAAAPKAPISGGIAGEDHGDAMEALLGARVVAIAEEDRARPQGEARGAGGLLDEADAPLRVEARDELAAGERAAVDGGRGRRGVGDHDLPGRVDGELVCAELLDARKRAFAGGELSGTEVERLLGATVSPKHRAMFMLGYGEPPSAERRNSAVLADPSADCSAAEAETAGHPHDWRALLHKLTGIDPRCCRACGSRNLTLRPLPPTAARAPPAQAA